MIDFVICSWIFVLYLSMGLGIGIAEDYRNNRPSHGVSDNKTRIESLAFYTIGWGIILLFILITLPFDLIIKLLDFIYKRIK